MLLTSASGEGTLEFLKTLHLYTLQDLASMPYWGWGWGSQDGWITSYH